MKNRISYLRSTLYLAVCLSLVTVLILTACSKGDEQSEIPAATTDPIENILWQWVSVTNQSTGDQTTVTDPNSYTITFYPDNTLSGMADCNSFNGTYSQENGFSIQLGAITEAYCGDDSLDQPYLELLRNVAAGGPDGTGGLALENAGGEKRMLFKDGGATDGALAADFTLK